MVYAPYLFTLPDQYVGFIVTPDGIRYFYSKSLPDNYVAYTRFIDVPPGVVGIDYFTSRFPDSKFYDTDVTSDLHLYYPHLVVRYSSPDNALAMARQVYGYPCNALSLLGAKFDLDRRVYVLGGEEFFCNFGDGYVTRPSANYVYFTDACFVPHKSDPRIKVKEGEVYFGKEVIGGCNSVFSFDLTVSKELLSYNVVLDILCKCSKSK